MESLSTRLDSGRLRERYRRLKERVATAAEHVGRRAQDLHLIAATDHATPDQIRQLVEMGQADLGESDIARLPQRATQLREFLGRKRFLSRFRDPRDARPGEMQDLTDESIRWHMLGPVPRSKLKAVVSLVHLIHCIDNLRIAEDLHTFAARQEDMLTASLVRRQGDQPLRAPDMPAIDVLLRVNTTHHEKHPGLAAPAAIHLAAQIDTMVNLRLRGLCVASPPDDDVRLTADAFERCRLIFEEIRAEKIGGDHFNILALGGDRDMETAIAHGGNLLVADESLFDAHEN